MRARWIRTAALTIAVGLAVATSPPVASAARRFVFNGGARTDRVETIAVGGVTYYRLSDLARAFGSSRHWNPRTRKMTLVTDGRRITVSDRNQFATLDGKVVNVRRRALLRNGSFWVPEPFLTVALGPAVNAGIVPDGGGGDVAVRTLAPAITSVVIEERGDGTAVILGLSARADFSVENAQRGTVVLLVREASAIDTLDALSGQGLVSRVTVEEVGSGARVVIGVTDDAGSYAAERLVNPYRIEVAVGPGGGSEIPAPALMKPRSLVPTPEDLLGDVGIGVGTVMIDPGYGGRESGGVGPTGLPAKQATLELAMELEEELEGEGFYVFMTRDSDEFIEPKRRAELANLAAADLFVSLQVNSHFSSTANGFQVLHYRPRPVSGAHAPERGGLERHGGSGRSAAVETLLWERVQERQLDESKKFAKAVHDGMAAAFPDSDRGIRSATLAVLAGCAMPAIQIEAAFISNRAEEERLLDRGFRRSVAEAIARGIVAYRRTSDRGNE